MDLLLREAVGPSDQVAAVAEQVVGTLGARVAHGRHAVRLAVHEILVNALEHGLPPVEVRVSAHAARLTVEVHDGGPGAPVVAGCLHAEVPTPHLAVRGRGLRLAAAGCDRLTVHGTAHGTAVTLSYDRTP